MSFFSDPISFLANWLRDLLAGWGLASGLIDVIMAALGVFVVSGFSLLLVVFLIWFERKIAARFQDRLGPNRVGPFGLFQTIADVIKIFTKEHITPFGVDVFVYNIAPLLSVSAVLLLWAVIPYASTVVGTDINVGVLYLVAAGAIGTLSIIMAGWSSNNKFALLGAFRAVAQMISYEVPMVLALLVPVLLSRSMNIGDLVDSQNIWFVFVSPLAAIIFLISQQAEVGRAPFDLLEAESELVAGFQTEYSGLKFGMFFVGEFLHSFTASALVATLFLGGWRGPGAESVPILGIVYFFIKIFLVYFIFLWMRFTLPRIRIDHLLDFNWKFLTPVALVLVIVTAILDKVLVELSVLYGVRVISHLVANLLIIWVTVEILRYQGRQKPHRKPVAAPRPVAVPPQVQSEPPATS